MIPITCHQCGSRMKVDDAYAGRSWMCGACGEPILVFDHPQGRIDSPPPFNAMHPQANAMYAQAPLPTSGKAIASLVLGLLTAFGGGFCLSGLLGIILGQSAIGDIRQGLCSGHDMARAGIILCVIGLLWPILLVFGFLFFGALAGVFAAAGAGG